MKARKKNPDEPVIYLLGHSALDRHAYRLLLAQELGYTVSVESSFVPSAIWKAMRQRPDLAIADTDTPTSEARDGIEMIPRLCPDTKIIVIGATVDPSLLKSWGALPISAYVVKDGGVNELKAALKAVRAGREHFGTGIRGAIQTGRGAATARSSLSRREAELLPLLARGMTLREAAATLTVSYKTADSYRTALLKKLGVRDRVELARFAIREKIIEP